MGKPKQSQAEYVAKHREKIAMKFARPGQPPVDGEFWIVRRINPSTKQFPHYFGVPHRHASIESAQVDADRQTASNPGALFGVFHFTGLIGIVAAHKPDLVADIEEMLEQQAA
jgi:hypothetical protein